MSAQPRISWKPPQSRSGWWKAWDEFMGPGATRAEEVLQIAGMLLLSALVGLYWWLQWERLQWTALQTIITTIFLLDLSGGIVVNASNSAKRWYHREGYTLRQHMTFIGVHLLHLVAFALLFDAYGLDFVLVNYGFLMGATLLLWVVPLYVQRPLGFLLYALAILMSLYWFAHPAGMEWFLPMFYLKLILAHDLKEAPFRPETETAVQDG
ncbi:MAG: hypothetical protein KC496_04810 [Anaerolineae bacterium]|nr:hypothetical protein [Anaerolineae bacterium]